MQQEPPGRRRTAGLRGVTARAEAVVMIAADAATGDGGEKSNYLERVVAINRVSKVVKVAGASASRRW